VDYALLYHWDGVALHGEDIPVNYGVSSAVMKNGLVLDRQTPISSETPSIPK
jgi:hypothetical protein